MATRRRPSGFTAPQEEETASVEEFLEENAREMFETFSQTEEEAEAKTEVVEAALFIPLEIVPTEDVGPRFVEEVAEPVPAPAPAPQLQPKPKRHPRNIPKFSRYK
jgi:hypothetical protein